MNPEEYEDYKLIFENMVEGVALHEMLYDENNNPINYRITKINKAYEQYTGITKEKAVGKVATELYGTKEAPYLKEYDEVITTKKPFLFETFFPPMNKWFFITVISPKEKQFVTIFQDITDRKKTELGLLLKNIVFDKSVTAIVVSDPNFTITEANDAFLQLGKHTREEVIGKKINFFFKNQISAVSVLASITMNGFWEGEVSAKRSDDTTFVVYGKANILKDSAGKTLGYSASVIDMTNYKKMESDIKKSNEELQSKLNELEKMNQLMIGRELSMVELKAKVTKLEEELAKKR